MSIGGFDGRVVVRKSVEHFSTVSADGKSCRRVCACVSNRVSENVTTITRR